ncbi:polysaccharide deacetylase family protein [Rhizobium sp. G187]|uniref:polysaccharide deacetylase family protein n=1 Tax=Rhizobium sp. G187 TaxID=3451352 RepID=UPI003EE74A0E
MAAGLKTGLRRAAIVGGLEFSFFLSRLGALPGLRGRGVIFTLHHVRPFQPAAFAPNRHLEITPEFLDAAILALKAEGYRFIPVEAVKDELSAPSAPASPFAAFTLDDGFRDNAVYAAPVFQRHGVPFTIFVCKGFSERSHTMWWETAAAMLESGEPVTIETGDGSRRLPCQTCAEKRAAIAALSRLVFEGDEATGIGRLNMAAYNAGIDPHAIVAESIMDSEELRQMARDPLVTLGAHTVSHRGLAALDDNTLLAEFNQSADYVAALTGKRPNVFAYPYGDERSATERTAAYAEWAGFKLSVTTRAGTLSPADLDRPHLVPRISLNGFYQKSRYVRALASGIPSRLAAG